MMHLVHSGYAVSLGNAMTWQPRASTDFFTLTRFLMSPNDRIWLWLSSKNWTVAGALTKTQAMEMGTHLDLVLTPGYQDGTLPRLAITMDYMQFYCSTVTTADTRYLLKHMHLIAMEELG